MTKQTQEFEVVKVEETSALQAITRAEVDIQIATAHKFPRSIELFKKRALEMATLDEETAASCIYRRPVGKGPDGKQKYAEGASVRAAEIVGASYGNLRVGAMIIEQTERQVKARGYAHDLESNFASTSEVIESTVKADGKPYDERMRIVVAKAALAKARRDATFAVVPKALFKPVEDAARRVAVGDEKTLEKRRTLAMQWINLKGIDPKRVFAALEINGESDMGLEQLEMLTGLRTAINDGDATIDEAFPLVATASKPLISKPEAKPASEPAAKKPAAEAAPTAEPSNGDKTRRLNAICQAQKIEIGNALKYLGEMGHASFEDVPDSLLLHIEKHPTTFTSQVNALLRSEGGK